MGTRPAHARTHTFTMHAHTHARTLASTHARTPASTHARTHAFSSAHTNVCARLNRSSSIITCLLPAIRHQCQQTRPYMESNQGSSMPRKRAQALASESFTFSVGKQRTYLVEGNIFGGTGRVIIFWVRARHAFEMIEAYYRSHFFSRLDCSLMIGFYHRTKSHN